MSEKDKDREAAEAACKDIAENRDVEPAVRIDAARCLRDLANDRAKEEQGGSP